MTRYYSALSEESMAQTKVELERAFISKYGIPDVIDKIGAFIDEHSKADENTTIPAGVNFEIDLEKRDKVQQELLSNLNLAFTGTTASEQQGSPLSEAAIELKINESKRLQGEKMTKDELVSDMPVEIIRGAHKQEAELQSQVAALQSRDRSMKLAGFR